MAIDIERGGALRSPSEIHALIIAVHGGADEDETYWVEWKSSLDVTRADGAYSVARGILGFANRDPDRAVTFMEGTAYFLAGVTPGCLHGVQRLDPAKVEDAVRPYLGDPVPRWGVAYHECDDRTVMVVTVEAPRLGDPIYLLCKSFFGPKGTSGAADGTVFIRRQGQTAPANSAEMRMLQNRLLSGRRDERALDLVVERLAGDGDRLGTLDLSEEAFDEWINRRREAVLAMQPRGRQVPEDPTFAAAMRQVLERDPRSREEYLQEVEDHLVECRNNLLNATVHEAATRALNVIVLRATNPAARNLPDVQLELTIKDSVAYMEEENHDWEMPNPPRAFGSPGSGLNWGLRGISDLGSLNLNPGLYRVKPAVLSRAINIDNGEEARIELSLGDLRPQGARTSEPFILVPAGVLGSALTIEWSATSTGVDARQDGSITLPVSERQLSPLDLVPYTDASDG